MVEMMNNRGRRRRREKYKGGSSEEKVLVWRRKVKVKVIARHAFDLKRVKTGRQCVVVSSSLLLFFLFVLFIFI